MTNSDSSMAGAMGHGVLASLAGTAVMTAFQKFVEMPITGRDDSYAPASFAEKVLPISPNGPEQRRRLNNATHFALGTLWGTGFAVASRVGLRGQRAVAAVFAVVYTGDVLLNTALGLYEPLKWSRKELAIDLIDKLVQAQATGAAFERLHRT